MWRTPLEPDICTIRVRLVHGEQLQYRLRINVAPSREPPVIQIYQG